MYYFCENFRLIIVKSGVSWGRFWIFFSHVLHKHCTGSDNKRISVIHHSRSILSFFLSIVNISSSVGSVEALIVSWESVIVSLYVLEQESQLSSNGANKSYTVMVRSVSLSHKTSILMLIQGLINCGKRVENLLINSIVSILHESWRRSATFMLKS